MNKEGTNWAHEAEASAQPLVRAIRLLTMAICIHRVSKPFEDSLASPFVTDLSGSFWSTMLAEQ